MNDLAIFQNEAFGQIRVAGTSEQPLFCAADICRALGYANSRDAIAKHVDEGDVAKRDTPTASGTQAITFVNESGMYALIFGSKLPNAKAFKRWVTSAVLPSIRKTGTYSATGIATQPAAPKLSEQLMWVREVKKLLNLNDASTLAMLQKISTPALPLPDYTPSKGVLKSATELLKERGLKTTAKDFNLCALDLGYLCEQQRKSSGGGVKTFKAVTEKGRPYGENQVSPKNPKETQPLWYADKFGELLYRLGIEGRDCGKGKED